MVKKVHTSGNPDQRGHYPPLKFGGYILLHDGFMEPASFTESYDENGKKYIYAEPLKPKPGLEWSGKKRRR